MRYAGLFLIGAFSCLSFVLYAQSNFGVNVYSFSQAEGYRALPYADIKDGTGNPITQSDSLGLAQWNGTDDKLEIVVSALGYTSDTLNLFRDEYAKVILYPEMLESTVIQSRRNSRQLGVTLNTTLLDQGDLKKAACCNLSESFETNPSVDVNHNDAITGTKQIEMLGLKSPYILITEENIPMVRGASQTYGLGFTPGTWIESIQVTKGMGSVINGYESIVGQINTEIKKPFSDMPFFFNLFSFLI